jgi:hypothetical protein
MISLVITLLISSLLLSRVARAYAVIVGASALRHLNRFSDFAGMRRLFFPDQPPTLPLLARDMGVAYAPRTKVSTSIPTRMCAR